METEALPLPRGDLGACTDGVAELLHPLFIADEYGMSRMMSARGNQQNNQCQRTTLSPVGTEEREPMVKANEGRSGGPAYVTESAVRSTKSDGTG